MTTTTTNLRSLINCAMGVGPNHYDDFTARLGFYYTEGCSLLAQNGAHWLVSDIICKIALDKRNTHTVKFVPNGKGGGRVNYYTTDERTGDSVKIGHQDYCSCSVDFPITFFVGETLSNTGNVVNLLMLAQEY